MADSGPDPATAYPANGPAVSKNPLRRLYHWILSWANHPWGTLALAVFSFLDSFVFPIPPLFLQVALSLERPKRSFWYAFVDTTASVVGAVMGYWIGYALWDSVGVRIVGDLSPEIRQKLHDNAFGVTLLYSFIPLPFKLITLGSGLPAPQPRDAARRVDARGARPRFFALGALCFVYGKRAKGFIERHFNGVCLAIGVLIAVALVVLKVVLKR
jgi:membrane protein YqaA with SNARE-associated domain